MPEEPADNIKVCFVVMGFGKKTDFETGRTLDLDQTYKNIIKPAAEDAGLKCIRADEIIHSGPIDVPMYEQLFTADVVIADLSTSNKNAFYELGVRHALRPYATIIIAEDGIKAFPFDLNHIIVRQYHHLGEDIGFSEVMRFRKVLTEAIKEIVARQPPAEDSPVYTFLKGLTPPMRDLAMRLGTNTETRTISRGADPFEMNLVEDPMSDSTRAQNEPETYSGMMQKVERAEAKGDFKRAKTLLGRVREVLKAGDHNRPEDPTLIQRHARATYKSNDPDPLNACLESIEMLKKLKPETSNDTETLGLWGAVNKDAWNGTLKKKYLDRAVRAYSRGFHLRNDYYNGINYAFLLNVRATHFKNKAEAIADFVEARRVREEVLMICEPLLKNDDLSKADKYWVRATMAEAYVGLGDKDKANQKLKEAAAFAPSSWMKEATEKQLAALKILLAQSPLKDLG